MSTEEAEPAGEDDGHPQPNPRAWPACSECDVPWVLRRGMTFSATDLAYRWLWQRDCKHKKAPVVKEADPS